MSHGPPATLSSTCSESQPVLRVPVITERRRIFQQIKKLLEGKDVERPTIRSRRSVEMRPWPVQRGLSRKVYPDRACANSTTTGSRWKRRKYRFLFSVDCVWEKTAIPCWLRLFAA